MEIKNLAEELRKIQDTIPVSRKDFKSSFDNVTRLVGLAIKELTTKIDSRLAKIQNGKDGAIGPKGLKGDRGDVGPKGNKGDIGPMGPMVDEQIIRDKIVQEVLIQAIPELEKRIPALSLAIRDALELLPVDQRPKVSLIDGLEEHIKEIVGKHFPYSMGGGAVVSVQQSGTQKVQQASILNFKGVGAPTVSIGSNGVTDLDFPSGGGGFTLLTATETPNGSTTVFTFSAATAKPSFIVSDNVMMQATTKAGTVNWTWNSGTKKATMTVPPIDDIIGIV